VHGRVPYFPVGCPKCRCLAQRRGWLQPCAIRNVPSAIRQQTKCATLWTRYFSCSEERSHNVVFTAQSDAHTYATEPLSDTSLNHMDTHSFMHKDVTLMCLGTSKSGITWKIYAILNVGLHCFQYAQTRESYMKFHSYMSLISQFHSFGLST
jgi:hypothetical protein